MLYFSKLRDCITTQRISPASAGGGFYLSAQSEYNLRLFGQRFYESPLLVKSRALKYYFTSFESGTPRFLIAPATISATLSAPCSEKCVMSVEPFTTPAM